MAAMALSERLHLAADRCCQDEGFEATELSIRAFLDLLERPLHDLELKQGSPAKWLAECEQVLQLTWELLDPVPSGLGLCKKVGLELPRVVVKFASLSRECRDQCVRIFEALTKNCSPREMYTALMEALNMYTAPQTLICCIPLVQGLSLAFSRLRRRQARFFQGASAGLLALVRLAAQDEEDDEEVEEEEASNVAVQEMDRENILLLRQVRAAIMETIVQLAQDSLRICDGVGDDGHRENFLPRLGMFALQILGITVENIARSDWEIPASLKKLVALLPLCSLPPYILVSKNQIEDLVEETSEDGTEDADWRAQNDERKFEATKGLALAAYWTLSNNQEPEVVEVVSSSIRQGLHIAGRKGVLAALSVASTLLIGRSPRPLSSVPAFGLTLIERILELESSLEFESCDDEGEDGCIAFTFEVLPALQRLQNLVVYAPNTEIRLQGYAALRKVIQGITPPASRLQCLQLLINNSLFPSLVALLLTCVKDEIERAWPSRPRQQGQPSTAVPPVSNGQRSKHVASPFLSEDVLEVIGNVLRPGTGVLPRLPAQIDPVLSALNLYRFILIRETAAKTNYTGVLSKEALTKARLQWLLPLRDLAGRLSLSFVMENTEMSVDMNLAVDTLQIVLYRCLELNEEALAHC